MNDAATGFKAVILAGRRSGKDPFAAALTAAEAVDHPVLIDIAGEPMLMRVIRALEASAGIDEIAIWIDAPEVLGRIPECASRIADGRLRVRTALDSPSRSVAAALSEAADADRTLIVTADHALLTPEMLERLMTTDPEGADVLVAVVTDDVLEAAYPNSPRTFLSFRDTRISGANLFAFLTPEARRAAEFWVRAEQYRKRPWRLASSFGFSTLLAFLFRRLSLDAAFERMSEVMNTRVRAVRMPWAEAAIDVDKPADLELVGEILARRAKRRS